MKILIRDGIVVTNEYEKKQNIFIEDGIITKLEENCLAEADLVLNAEGSYILPGLVDAHCHLRDPGFDYKEDIVSGTKAQLWVVLHLLLAWLIQILLQITRLLYGIIDKAQREGYVHVFPIGAMTKGLKGEELAEIGEMKQAGIVAISDDGRCVENSSVMKKVMQYAKMFDVAVVCQKILTW